uniref:SET domain-containing protein n=1 Tax=Eutreptiella gymnastica TaxID=73025 RepID=A0A7S1I2S5_9EUGL|mmetsp:Transcript_124831/g.216384  ORF Transcript_124831/g.216384 Transcript_124831/m.216384 type:complete len:369 (+) Transcript_124831:59-1165(+)
MAAPDPLSNGILDIVKVKKVRSKGRCLVTNENLASGTVVMKEETPCAIVTEEWRDNVCDNCLFRPKCILDSLPLSCPQCCCVSYCSEECLSTASDKWHAHECQALQQLYGILHEGGLDGASDTYSLARFLIRIIAIACHDGSFADCFGALHGRDADLRQLKRWDDLQKIGRVVSASLTPACTGSQQFGLEAVMDYVAKEEWNSFAIRYTKAERDTAGQRLKAGDEGMFAYAIAPSSSLLNHSCCPNVFKRWDGRTLLMQAVRPIRQGEELCHSYVIPSHNTSRRLRELGENHGFECSCKRCEDRGYELDWMELFVCPRTECGGLLCPIARPVAAEEDEEPDDEVLVVCQWCAEPQYVEKDALDRLEHT